MSWFRKLVAPKIKREPTAQKKAVPEGLWSKCSSCEAVLYFTDLENNLHVCPKCSFHNRLGARQRLDLFLDAEGRAELASEVVPMDPLKFKDSRKYTERIEEAVKETGETDALVVMQGSVKGVPLVAAAFEFGIPFFARPAPARFPPVARSAPRSRTRTHRAMHRVRPHKRRRRTLEFHRRHQRQPITPQRHSAQRMHAFRLRGRDHRRRRRHAHRIRPVRVLQFRRAHAIRADHRRDATERFCKPVRIAQPALE